MGQFDEQNEDDEKVELILWYRLDDSTTTIPIQTSLPSSVPSMSSVKVSPRSMQPIYSLDARPLRFSSGSGSSTHSSSNSDSLVPIPSNYSLNGHSLEDQSSLLGNVMSSNARHYALASMSKRIKLKVEPISFSPNISTTKATHTIPMASLIIDRVTIEDSGLYKCRVDFKFGRTRQKVIKLDVIGK